MMLSSQVDTVGIFVSCTRCWPAFGLDELAAKARNRSEKQRGKPDFRCAVSPQDPGRRGDDPLPKALRRLGGAERDLQIRAGLRVPFCLTAINAGVWPR